MTESRQLSYPWAWRIQLKVAIATSKGPRKPSAARENGEQIYFTTGGKHFQITRVFCECGPRGRR